jgi:serine/threonine protein kinase/Flp pilus assembly protein TadD
MSDTGSGPDLLNELANDFAERCRRGERPGLSEYTAKHPELAAEIRDLFPAVAVIEEFGRGAAPTGPHAGSATSYGAPPRQLGEYRILREVARGGMGIVYEALQESLGRHVAVKVLPFQSLADAHQLERFRREARAAAMLHHTNIVPVFGVGEHEGIHYFVMQFIRGPALDWVLHELRGRRRAEAGDPGALADETSPIDGRRGDAELTCTLAGAMMAGRLAGDPEAREGQGDREEGQPPPGDPAGPGPGGPSGGPATEAFEIGPEWDSKSDMPYFRSVARVGLQVAEALAYAHHQGVLHRDIKPANILLDTHGTAWVTDFGLAKADGSDDLTGQGHLVGTLRYMAPERFRGQSDPRSDVFSLGLTLYEMATLRPAFVAPDRAQLIARMLHDEPPRPRAIDGCIPRDLETLILKAIAKEPAQRYQTAGELAADLQRFLADRPVRARQSRWPERLWRGCRRDPALALATTAAAVLLLMAVAVLAISNVLIQREQARTKEEKVLAQRSWELAEHRAEEIRRGLEGLKSANVLQARARYCAGELRWGAAYSVLTQAIQVRPDHVSAWADRSDLLLRMGLWDLASEDLARAFELQEPDETGPWYCLALLRLYVGDLDGYRRRCRQMREHSSGIGSPHFDIHMARACALAPVPGAEPTALVEEARCLADVRDRPGWYLYVLGMAHYRAGQPEQAVRQLREFLVAESQGRFKPIAYPLLAMAHHRLGQTAEARQALEEAARAIERWTQDIYQKGSVAWAPHLGTTGYWPISWWDWLECQLFYREANALIDGVPPTDDPRLRVVRARAFARLGQQERADAEYTEALKQRPDNTQFLLEVHRNRGYRAVRCGRWSRAAAEFERASDLHPTDARLWSFVAVAHLGAGELAAYRRACAAMVERFEGIDEPGPANDVVGACVLADDAIPDMARLLPLARVAATRHIGNACMLGATLYRAGRYDEAVKSFDEAAKAYPLRADAWSLLAMAHHRLGHSDDARRCLAGANHWIEAANRVQGDDTGRVQPAWGGWEERIGFPLLLREAERLIGPCHAVRRPVESGTRLDRRTADK